MANGPIPPPEDLRKLRKEARERFLAGRRAETQYANRLRQVAKQIDAIVRGMAPDGRLTDAAVLVRTLNRYAEILGPWAETVAKNMLADVAKRDAAAWSQHGKMIGRALRLEIEKAPTGTAMREALGRQVRLITSIPRDAAERVQKLSLEAFTGGVRAKSIAEEILESGQVSRSRAMCIARTEVSRVATALTQARAEYVGSEGYIWRTARDGDVRRSHREMEGKLVKWNDPPVLDEMRGHAGQLPNCRCFPEVVLPERAVGVAQSRLSRGLAGLQESL